MRTLFISTFLLLLAFAPSVLSAQDSDLKAEADKLFERISKRPERAWDYDFALRTLADSEEGASLVATFESKLEDENDHVRMVASHLTLLYGEPELAYLTWTGLLDSNHDDVVESAAMMITAEGPEDEEFAMSVELAWEEAEERSVGARVALSECLLVNQKHELALQQLREFASSSDHELVGRASLVLSERGYANEVKGRIDSLSSEPGNIGRLARIGREVVKINQGVEDHKSGKFKRQDSLIEAEIRVIKTHYAQGFFHHNDKALDLNNENLVDNACRAMAGATDRYGTYMTRAEYDEMNEDQEGRYVGIGAHVAADDDGVLYVTQPIYEGPAYKAGLRTGDKLVGVIGPDGKRVDLTKLTLQEGVDYVRGPENSTATLFIRRRGEEQERKLSIKRQIVKVDTALEEMLPGQVGYIRLTRFGTNSVAEMKKSLGNLRRQGMTTLILDLRNNGGGQLKSVIEIADLFLPRGRPISSAGGVYGVWKGRKGPWKSQGGDYNEIEMVCLIDEDSASGAEMLSGALKDNKRALVIGRPSFGKDIGQSFFSVEGSGESRVLKCTVFTYYLPSGISINRYKGEGGVQPNIRMSPQLLEPWEVYAINDLRDSDKLDEYLDVHYKGMEKATLMKLASFDALQPSRWPEFDKFYSGLNTNLAKNDVRRELRFAARKLVQDDRGAEFTQNYQEDKVILRSVKELFKKTGKDPMKIPQYKLVMD